jgi:ribosomal protein S18 acetylase RimI-like enzyme
MLGLQIRPVDERNIELVKCLHLENFDMVYDDVFYDQICGGLENYGFLAFWGGSAVGEISVEWQVKQGRLVLYVQTLSVAADHRRRGVATLLMSRVRDTSPDASYIYLHTEADNRRSHPLYRKLGFVATKRIPDFYQDNRQVDAIVFRWTNPLQSHPDEHLYIYEILLARASTRISAAPLLDPTPSGPGYLWMPDL